MQLSARRTEIHEDPRSTACEVRDLVVHLQCLTIHLSLIFLGPLLVFVAKTTSHGTCTELAHHHGLVLIKEPFTALTVRRFSPIPSQIVVETEDIHQITEIILHRGDIIMCFRFHGHADQTVVIQLSCPLNKSCEEMIASLSPWSFIGHTPYNNGTAVMIALDIISKLSVSIVIGFLVIPLDSPIHRDLAPHHQALFLGHAHHLFVMRIVSQTDKVTS